MRRSTIARRVGPTAAAGLAVAVAYVSLGIARSHQHTVTDPAYYSAFMRYYREISGLSPGTFLNQRWGYLYPMRISAWVLGEEFGYLVPRLVLLVAVLALCRRALGGDALRTALCWVLVLTSPILWRLALVHYAGAYASVLAVLVALLLIIDLGDDRDRADRERAGRWVGIGVVIALSVAAHSLSTLVIGPLWLAWAWQTRRRSGLQALRRSATLTIVGAVAATVIGRVVLRIEIGSSVSWWPFAEGGGVGGLRVALQALRYGGWRWVQWSQQLLWVPALWVVWWWCRRRVDQRFGDRPSDLIGLAVPVVAAEFTVLETLGRTPILEHFGYSGQLVALGLVLIVAVVDVAVAAEQAVASTRGAALVGLVAVGSAALIAASLGFRSGWSFPTWPTAILVIVAGFGAVAVAAEFRRSETAAVSAALGAVLVAGTALQWAAPDNPSPSAVWEMAPQYSRTFFDPDDGFDADLASARELMTVLRLDEIAADGSMQFVRPDRTTRAVTVACRSTYPWGCLNDAVQLLSERLAFLGSTDAAEATALRGQYESAPPLNGRTIRLWSSFVLQSPPATVVAVAESGASLDALVIDLRDGGLRLRETRRVVVGSGEHEIHAVVMR